MSEIVPATVEHIAAIYGKPLGRTVRALAVVDGERVLGVGGIYQDEGRAIVFTRMTDELRGQRRIVIQAARRIMGWLNDEAFAKCDTSIPQARGFLEHFGFQRIHGEIYKWQTQ